MTASAICSKVNPIYLLAIDPGTTGSWSLFSISRRGIVLLRTCAFGLKKHRDTWEAALSWCLTVWQPDIIVREKVGVMSHDGRQGAFTFGGNTRAIDTVLKLHGRKTKLVEPQAWQRRCGLPHNYHLVGKEARRKQGRKDQKALALRLFPDLMQVKGDVFGSVLIGYAAALDHLQIPAGQLDAGTGKA